MPKKTDTKKQPVVNKGKPRRCDSIPGSSACLQQQKGKSGYRCRQECGHAKKNGYGSLVT